jgi:hypothetical protein
LENSENEHAPTHTHFLNQEFGGKMSTTVKKVCVICILVLVAVITNLGQGQNTVFAAKQSENAPTPPLYPGLTWNNLGSASRTITLSIEGASMSLSGGTYQAVEKFDSGLPQAIMDFYSNEQLAKAGWVSYDAYEKPEGVYRVFYHDAGVYLFIEYLQCAEAPASTCITVWNSQPVVNALTAGTPAAKTGSPQPKQQTVAATATPGTFKKKSPANTATNIDPASVVLSWYAYSPTPDKYSYCIKEGSACSDDDPNWTGAYTNTSVTLTNLGFGKTYYWQVKAITCVSCTPKKFVYADGDTWWTFKTKSSTVISGNTEIGGATLSYVEDAVTKTVTSASNGSYSISVPLAWSGTVTPSKPGYAFTPTSRSYTNLQTSQSNQNYVAAMIFYNISGKVGTLSGATVSYFDTTAKTVTTDASGNYTIKIPYGWKGALTPSKLGYVFTPAAIAVSTGLTADLPNQNFVSAPAPYFGLISRWTTSFDYSHGWRVDQHPRLVGDVNGDGSADAIGFGLDGVYVALSNGVNGFGAISRWTTDFDYSHGWRVDQHPRLVGDVNNDGKADAIGFGLDGVYVALSNGVNAFGPISRWTTDFDYSHGWRVDQHPRLVGDVNGDGSADAIGFGLDGVYVAISNGLNGFGPISRWTTDFDYSHGWRVSQHPRMVGDVNGDHKADLVGFGLDGVYVAISNGLNGFSPISRWTTDFDYSHGWRVDQHPRMDGDVNNDGFADVIGFGLDGVYVGLSNGVNGFDPIRRWTTDFDYSHGWRVNQHPRMVGDVNNDGRIDLVGFGLDGVYIGLSQPAPIP